MIDFPNAPTVGQVFTAAGGTWTWDGVKWTPSGVSASYLPLAGGTMTGPVALTAGSTSATPSAGDSSTKLATTAFVSALPVMGDNRVDNGDMWIDQHNSGASVPIATTGGFCPDRWAGQASKAHVTVGQNYAGFAKCPGFQYYLGAQTTSAWGTIAAADYTQIWETIEADRIGDFMFGTANAQTVTLSFWVISSLTGSFSAALQAAGTSPRVYVFTYSIPTANTWTKIVQTVPGDTTGTWVMTGNTGGISVGFDLGSGTTYRTSTLNAWQTGPSGGYIGATGAVSLIATLNAKWAITGVKLELGSQTTPFEHKSLARKLADCQRYYETGTNMTFSGNVTSGVNYYAVSPFKITKRANPTMAVISGSEGDSGFAAGAVRFGQQPDSFNTANTANATVNGGYYQFNWTASAEI